MDSVNFLKENNIAYTALRSKIVEILKEHKTPVSCDELVVLTGANKTTIYRNIALLQEKNLIVVSENNHKSFYELATNAKAYFVCDNCHKMKEIAMPVLEQKNVKSVVVKGICDECQK